MRCLASLGCLLALAAFAAPVLAQTLYQWKDTHGVHHYSDTPPPGRELQGSRINVRDSQARGDAVQPREVKADNPQCTQAKRNQEALHGNAPVHEIGEDGNAGKELTPQERANQLALADATARAYCQHADTQ